jgi:VCBS repeat-containing protein
VAITVNPVNDSPVAVNDTYAVGEGTTLNVSSPGVLANDSDPDGDGLTAALQNEPAHGTVTLNANGSFQYTPTAGYFGPDSFTYSAEDGHGGSASAAVTITIDEVNEPPVAGNDNYEVDEGNVLSVAAPGVLANDSDPDDATLSATQVTAPAHGTLSLNSNGSFTYTPNVNFNGSDGFTYQVSDGRGGTDNGTVTITVHAVNDFPVAVDDSYSVIFGNTLSVSAPGVLANDTDVDGDGLFASVESAPSNGTLSLSVDGSFSYTPASGFVGTDTFTYLVSDGHGGDDVGLVTVTINPSQITYEQTVTGGASSSTTVSTASNVNGVSGRIYLAAIASKNYTSVANVTGLGITWTRVIAQCAGRNQTGVEVWVAHGSPLVSGIVTATLSTAPSNAVIAVTSYSGADVANPIGSVISGNTKGLNGTCSGGSDKNSYSFNITTTQDGSMVYGAIAMRSVPHTPGSGYIERVEIFHGGSGGSAAGLAVVDKTVAVAGAVTLNGTFNNNVDWAVAGIELKRAGGSSQSAATSLASNSLAAETALQQHTLSVNSLGSGSVEWDSARDFYNEGTEITLTANPETGWEFSGWGGDLTGKANPATITMNSDKHVIATFTKTDLNSEIPTQYQLYQNYPNPFNPNTVIRYSLPETNRVRLVVYDLEGRVVATLVDEVQKAGNYSCIWEARDAQHRPMASGIYFYRLQAGSYEKSFRMLLVR